MTKPARPPGWPERRSNSRRARLSFSHPALYGRDVSPAGTPAVGVRGGADEAAPRRAGMMRPPGSVTMEPETTPPVAPAPPAGAPGAGAAGAAVIDGSGARRRPSPPIQPPRDAADGSAEEGSP